MLTYQLDRTDPVKEVSAGVHSNDADDPVDFPFTVDHAKGADSVTIRSDINTFLGTQSRTGYNPTQAYNPDGISDEMILKDSVDGTTVWCISVDKSGVITADNVTE